MANILETTALDSGIVQPTTPDAESILKSDSKRGHNIAATRASMLKEFATFGTKLAEGDEFTLKTVIGWKFSEGISKGLLKIDDALAILESIHSTFNKAAEKRSSPERRPVGADLEGNTLVSHLRNFGSPVAVKNWDSFKTSIPAAWEATQAKIDAIADKKARKEERSKVKSCYLTIQRVLSAAKKKDFVVSESSIRDAVWTPPAGAKDESEMTAAEKAEKDRADGIAKADDSAKRLQKLYETVNSMAQESGVYDAKELLAVCALLITAKANHEPRVTAMKEKVAAAYAKAMKKA